MTDKEKVEINCRLLNSESDYLIYYLEKVRNYAMQMRDDVIAIEKCGRKYMSDEEDSSRTLSRAECMLDEIRQTAENRAEDIKFLFQKEEDKNGDR